MSEHGNGGMKSNYYVWIWLLALTGIEVFLAYIHLPVIIMLVSLLGLSVVKAALIVAYFMHMKFERLNLVLTIVPAFVLCILLFNVIFPDAVRLRDHAVNRQVTPRAGEAEAGH
ncbi:MAG: cytochrome C oxidase subunit IV family protein [Acidobacteriota bacterium]|jgi:cytochrome c oxidase subunit 4